MNQLGCNLDGRGSNRRELPLSGRALLDLLQAVLDRGKPFRFRAKGFSMLPFVKDGDIITVSPLSSRRPRFGDLVAYVSPDDGTLAVHRVMGRKDGRYSISGDISPDGPDLASAASILGRVTRVERNGRNILVGMGPERRLIAALLRYHRPRQAAKIVWRVLRSMHLLPKDLA